MTASPGQEQHISRLEDLRIALDLMEPRGMAGETGPYTLASAIEHYHRLHAEIAADEPMREYYGNCVCGEAIYGNGGWHRYYLRLDGYVYFSTFHSHERAIADARSLGFRLN